MRSTRKPTKVVPFSVHLHPDQARHAEGLIATVKRIWDRYEPLIGPYPTTEYAIVDNFFSSGFAYPTFTLLSSACDQYGAAGRRCDTE